jgi:hypothetical protein
MAFDRFRFEIGPREPVGDDSKAVRFKVDAYIGNQRWERFPIDLFLSCSSATLRL